MTDHDDETAAPEPKALPGQGGAGQAQEGQGSQSAPLPAGTAAARREPAFNLPQGLVWILGLLTLIHVVRTYILSPALDDELLFNLAFLPARYTHPLAEQSLAWLWSPVSYSLLHGGWDHLLFNSIWMLAFGAPVIRRIGMARLVLFWCLSAAAAVALHAAVHWGDETIVIGASGVVSALMGAAARFVFSPGGRIDRQSAHLNRLLTLRETLSNRTVLIFTGLWFATNLLTGLGLFAVGGSAGIAWEAHMGGFLFGFLAFRFFDPRAQAPAVAKA